uniref:Uncharacterized protein n=1 Tax=Vibrio tasmaniensis TaxID=212663 RepID=A0A0H3ZQN6_9VIBR|nr:hypothetical protein [Vibrio tasmaniensis]
MLQKPLNLKSLMAFSHFAVNPCRSGGGIRRKARRALT